MNQDELKFMVKVFSEFASPTLVARRKGGSLAAQKRAITPILKKYEAKKGECWENENEDFEGKNLQVQRYHFLVNLKPVDFAFLNTKDKKDIGLELFFNGGKGNFRLETWTGTYEDVYLNGRFRVFGDIGCDFGNENVLCSITAAYDRWPDLLQDELQKRFKANFCNYLESGNQLADNPRHTHPSFLINQNSFIGLIADKASKQSDVDSHLIKKSDDWHYDLKMKIKSQEDAHRDKLFRYAFEGVLGMFFIGLLLWPLFF